MTAYRMTSASQFAAMNVRLQLVALRTRAHLSVYSHLQHIGKSDPLSIHRLWREYE